MYISKLCEANGSEATIFCDSILVLQKMDSSSVTSKPVDDDDSLSYSTTMINVKILVVAIFVMVLMVLLVTAIIHLYVRWVRGNFRWGWGRTTDVQRHRRMHEADAAGLDKGVLDALPTFVYTKESMKEPMECSVCINDFQENETGRLLPKCNHCFHIACIDMWFNSHSTCPLCRAIVGEKPISHEDGENMPMNEEMGVPETPSHGVIVEMGVAEEQIGTDGDNMSNNAFGMQGRSSEEQQQQEDSHSNTHILNASMQYPVNTLFYGNGNNVSSFSSYRAEQVKKSEHLVVEVPNRPAIYLSDSAPRTTPTTPPTPNSVHESRTRLSHLKTTKQILSMRETQSSVPATPKRSKDQRNLLSG